jgi:type IV pilus assembly protein PilO
MAITVSDIKKLSPQAKALVVVLVLFVIGYLYYFLFLSDVLAKKATLDNELELVRGQIKEKEKIALQLNKYKEAVAALQENYKIALLKLPDQREIPGLFHSVAMAGRDAGIEFILFEPKTTIPKTLQVPPSDAPKAAALLKPSDQRQSETKPAPPPPPPAPPPQKAADGKKGAAPAPQPFYEEIPVAVTVTGTFQNTVYFFEKVAKLPRIVNISDVTMGDRKDVKGRGYLLTTSCTVKTYMFIDKTEKVSEKAK